MLAQWHLPLSPTQPPPLTSTVKLSLFTHEHSSPLSLAARLHRCCTNCSRYINNGWTFSGQTLYMRIFSSLIYIYLNREQVITWVENMTEGVALRKKGKGSWKMKHSPLVLLQHLSSYMVSMCSRFAIRNAPFQLTCICEICMYF